MPLAGVGKTHIATAFTAATRCLRISHSATARFTIQAAPIIGDRAITSRRRMAKYPGKIDTAMAAPKNSLKACSSALSAVTIAWNTAIQSPDNAAPKPTTTRVRPAARCHSGRLQRKPGAN